MLLPKKQKNKIKKLVPPIGMAGTEEKKRHIVSACDRLTRVSP